MKNLSGSVIAATGLLMLAATSAVHAQSPISDSLTIFDPNGNVVATGSVDEAHEDAGQTIQVGDSSMIDPTMFGNAITVIEPGTKLPSDIFGIATINGSETLAFNSDTDTASEPFASSRTVDEGNGIFDATEFLSADFRNRGYTAQFISDAGTPTPEPTSVAAFGIGVLGLGVIAMAKRRRASAF